MKRGETAVERPDPLVYTDERGCVRVTAMCLMASVSVNVNGVVIPDAADKLAAWLTQAAKYLREQDHSGIAKRQPRRGRKG